MKRKIINVIQRSVAISLIAVAFACAVRPAEANQLYSGYFTDNSGDYSCDTTTYPSTTKIVTRPELANKCKNNGSYDRYRTTVYWGEMYFAAGTYRFAGTFDDYIWVKINGSVVLSEKWDYGVAYGNVTIPTSGWYPVEFRFHNNDGPQADGYYHDGHGWACGKCLCIQNITSNPSSTDRNPNNFTVVGLDANGSEIPNLFRLPTVASSLYNGLVAWYKFDGNANDSSGNGNHGTPNGVTPTADRFGNANGAYQFGSGKYIQVRDSSSLRSFGGSITMSAWIRPDSWYNSTWLAILCKGTSSGDHGFDFKLDVAGQMCMTESFEGLGGYVGYSPSLDFGSWQLVTVTHDGSTARVYVNGVLRGLRTFPVGTLNYSNDLMIGVDRPGVTEYFYGAMDDLRIYNRALSAAEVAALYTGTTVTHAGFIPTTKVKLCSGGSALDIVGATGYFCSGCVDVPGDVSACNFKVKGTTVTAQFQKADDRFTKCLGVEFTTESDGVYVRAVYSRYRDGTTHVGEDFDTGSYSSNTPASSEYSVNGYGIKNLRVQMGVGGSAGLIHRWSFNGSLADSVGGATARSLGSHSWTSDGKSISLPGGSHGTSGVDLGANLLPTDGTPVTIEIWAKNHNNYFWSRILDVGAGTGSTGESDAFLMSWCDQNDLSRDGIHAYDDYDNFLVAYDCLSPYELGKEYHISVTFVPNRDGDGRTVMSCYKRSSETGAIQRQYSFKSPSGWTLSSLTQNVFYLGRSQWTSNGDAQADYNEVRIWNRALSEAELTRNAQLGPDVLPTGYVVPTPSPLATALNTTQTVTTGGDANWFVQASETHDGVSAAQSGDIDDNQQSWMEATVDGPAEVSFWWKVDSEGAWDWLRFAVDGTEQYAISGCSEGSYYYCTGGDRETRVTGVYNGGWEKRIVTIGSGSHTLKWSYTKDGSCSPGSDCGWVDQLVVSSSANGVTFGKNGGTGGDDGVTVVAGATPADVTPPTRTGYTFGGYWTSVGASGEMYFDGSGRAVRAWNLALTGVKLWAKWSAITCVATFDKQGGTGGDLRVTVNYDATPHAVTVPSRTGYTFAGYWTSTSGGTKYFNADGSAARTWKIGSTTTTLYARWTGNAYRLTFGKNAGTGGDDYVTATYQAMPHDIRIPTRTGYTFGGYWTSTGASGVQYFDGAGKACRVWDKPTAATLWALWTRATYTLTLGKNGGAGGDESVSVQYGAVPRTITVPTRTGYAFGGYWTSTGTSGVQYYAADGLATRAWDKGASATLWAKWTGKTYTVTFGKNGGTGGDDRKTVTFGSKASSVIIPRKGDASFVGYWTSTGSSGVQYFGADGSATRVWDKTQDITLWAKWSNAITFSKNGGSGGDARVTAYHAEIPHAITPPTRAGWIFDGYWTSLSGGSEIYFADGAATGKWTGTANLTLVAKWTQGTAYQVTFDKRGGTGGGAYVRVARGVAMPRIVLPTRTGYTFAGYWTTPSGEGVQYYRADGTSARNWNAAKGGTLYARWVEK